MYHFITNNWIELGTLNYYLKIWPNDVCPKRLQMMIYFIQSSPKFFRIIKIQGHEPYAGTKQNDKHNPGTHAEKSKTAWSWWCQIIVIGFILSVIQEFLSRKFLIIWLLMFSLRRPLGTWGLLLSILPRLLFLT